MVVLMVLLLLLLLTMVVVGRWVHGCLLVASVIFIVFIATAIKNIALVFVVVNVVGVVVQ